MTAFILLVAASGSSEEQTADTTARHLAPARTTLSAVSSLIPPIATSGWRLNDLILRRPSNPQGFFVSVFVGVAKTGLTPI